MDVTQQDGAGGTEAQSGNADPGRAAPGTDPVHAPVEARIDVEKQDERDGGANAAAFSGRLIEAVMGFAETASVALGARLGWYRALADAGGRGLTADGLAERSGTAPRYAKEWLEQQAVAGLLEMVHEGTDPGGEATAGGGHHFRMPPGAARALTDEDSLEYLAPMVRMLMAGVMHFPDLLQAYRTGGGVAWAQIGDEARESQADGNRPWFEQELAPALAGVEGLHAILSRPGARIADIGCGFGWSTLALADAYPGATVTGIDIDDPSIVQARENARQRGLSDKVDFRVVDAATLDALGPCDAVFIFEALHDMPFPVEVLTAIRGTTRPDGAVVVMDEGVADTFAPNGDELERLMYAYSLFICLPDSLSTPGSVGTGTVMRPATLGRYARAAGFSRVETLPIEGFSVFRFYRLHP